MPRAVASTAVTRATQTLLRPAPMSLSFAASAAYQVKLQSTGNR